jgi:DNA-binding CsgD family transcriptional regulator
MAGLAERVIRVRLLLETLNDPYPTPRGALVPDSGPAPSRYVPCETCMRRGEVRVRGGWQLCLLCEGQGWKRREHEQPWDAYVELPLVDAAELPREPTLASPISDEMREQAYGWERLRDAYDRHGSYRQVRLQLDHLSLVAPLRFRLVRTVIVEHELRELDATMHVQMQLGVVQIARRIPNPRVPAWLLERSYAAERRDTIEALAADGFTAGEIARKLGIPKGTARKYLKRASGRLPMPGNPLREVREKVERKPALGTISGE